jgi:hypothetical protein
VAIRLAIRSLSRSRPGYCASGECKPGTPEEIGELPESDQYVSIEVIGPGERSGQRTLLSVERFNQLAAGGDMQAILLNAVADRQPQRPRAATPAGTRAHGNRWAGQREASGGVGLAASCATSRSWDA